MAAAVNHQNQNEDFAKYKQDCEKKGFRDFSKANKNFDRVYQTYLKMHTHQCYDFVQKRKDYWLKFNHGDYTIMEVVHMLDHLVDEADPDVDFPNSFHAFQTAEGLRAKYPDKDWLHLCGLVHDLGKVMGIWGEEHYCNGGDTYVVGARFADSIVYRETTFTENPDLKNPKYNTKYGIYEQNCGLDNLYLSWGHDEYMYQVLKHNNCTLPDIAMYCIRYHSFYPWHTGGDYDYFCNEKDREMMHWVRNFNKHDLYTKSPDLPDTESLKPYYQTLVDKYMPGKLKW